MILFGMIASMGVKVLVDNQVNITETKNMIILAIILVMGLGFSAGGVNAHIKDVSISALAIATLAGIILNLILPDKSVSIGTESESISPVATDENERKELKDEKDEKGAKSERTSSSGKGDDVKKAGNVETSREADILVPEKEEKSAKAPATEVSTSEVHAPADSGETAKDGRHEP
jgi:hypothetical protein